MYRQVRDNPQGLIQLLGKYRNNERAYYKIRDSSPRTPLSRAVRLLYLTRLAFNGIYRVNLDGYFNVPYGKKSHLSTCDPDRLLKVSHALRAAVIRHQDFERATTKARSGAVIYFDPPYTVAHENNGFVKYNEKIFSWDDQVRLANHARVLAQRGCHVVISNADHASIRKLYVGFSVARVTRFSRIAASSDHRREISELIFVAPGKNHAS
jgi:DNA adenine methylase